MAPPLDRERMRWRLRRLVLGPSSSGGLFGSGEFSGPDRTVAAIAPGSGLRFPFAPNSFRLHPCVMRRVIKSDQGPLEIKPQEKSVWICMCGLSANQPFCDGSHKRTRDEEEGKTYLYDGEGHRTEITN